MVCCSLSHFKESEEKDSACQRLNVEDLRMTTSQSENKESKDEPSSLRHRTVGRLHFICFTVHFSPSESLHENEF